MKLFSEDIIILKQLYYKKVIRIYDLHLLFKLSPGQITRSIEKFENEKILEEKSEDISITEYGEKWIISNRRFIFLKKFDYICDYNYELYSINKLGINELYKPNLYRLDKRIFKNKEGD